ncbi:hypothetical protein, partial [Salmonella sp. 2020_1435]|uniref:hypothetical protein n=1 Tax=Salmonella sp. 2020_1435 TaxID=3143311 RepID=UPI003752D4B3
VPAYGPQNDVTLKMPAFEWVHVQLHQQKGMISLSPPTICNSAATGTPKGLSDVVPGDEVVVEVEGVGRLVNRIVSEESAK